MIKTSRIALATHLCLDASVIEDYRYQPSRADRAIYALGDEYFCAVPEKKKPARHRDRHFEWQEVVDPFVNKFGFKIWTAK